MAFRSPGQEGHLLEQAEPEAYGAQFAAPGGRATLPVILNSGKWWLKRRGFVVSDHKTVAQSGDGRVIATDADRK